MDTPSSGIQPSTEDVDPRPAHQVQPTTGANFPSDERAARVTGQSNPQNQAQEQPSGNPTRSPDMSQGHSTSTAIAGMSQCRPVALRKALQDTTKEKAHFVVLDNAGSASKKQKAPAPKQSSSNRPQDMPQVEKVKQRSVEATPFAGSHGAVVPPSSEAKLGGHGAAVTIQGGNKNKDSTNAPRTHSPSPSPLFQRSAMFLGMSPSARKTKTASIMPTSNMDTSSDRADRILGTKHRVRRGGIDKACFEDLMKENKALLEEVEAMKRQKEPERSMFQKGVQKLMAVPRDRHVYGDLARRYTSRLGSRLVGQRMSSNSEPVLQADGNDPRNPSSVQPSKPVAFAVGFCVEVVFLAFIITLFLMSATGAEKRAPQAHLCETADCRIHALYISYRLNNSVQPCDDFQAHVCSAWQPPEGFDQLAKTAVSEVVVRWMKELRQLLQGSIAGGIARRKALFLLEACMAKRKEKASDARRFRSFMAKLNLTWPGDPSPNVSALGVLLDLAYNWRMTLWLNLRLSVDPVTLQPRRLIINEGNRDELLFLAVNHKHLLDEDLYITYWKSHYAVLYDDVKEGANSHHHITEMYESASVQGDVFRTLLSVVRKHPKSPIATTVRGIEGYTTGRLSSAYWLQRLREHVFLRGADSFTEGTEVLVSDPIVLHSIGRLFATYTDAEIIRQVSWEFLQLHILAVDKIPLDISFSGRVFAMPYVAVYCTRYVEGVYAPLLASLYARLHLSVGDREALDANFDGLINAAVDNVSSLPWLGRESKLEAVAKLHSARTIIWPQKEYFTDEGLEAAYATFPRDKNASFLENWIKSQESLRQLRESPLYAATISLHPMISFSLVDYDYLKNKVRVAMSALTNPVYYPQGSRAMFYGGLGFLYTSEMLKVLDETGSKVRANGMVADSWLSSEEVDAMEKNRHCQGVRHNGSFLANLGALELTYSKFQATKVVDGGRVIRENVTEEQVFFFTLCSILCDLPSAEPASISCNALFRNSAEFATAFSCGHESPMNPKEKCRYFDASKNSSHV